MLEVYLVFTSKESDGHWGSQFKDLGSDQGKIYDHVVVIIHSELYLGDTLTEKDRMPREGPHIMGTSRQNTEGEKGSGATEGQGN